MDKWPAYAGLSAVAPAGHLPTAPTPRPGTQPKWEKLTGERYAKVVANEETGVPGGLGLETIPGFRMLMQENRDRQVFAKLGG